MLLTLITFILVLSVLVFVHEWGHFYTARLFKVRADEFGFGFPPRVFSWYKNAAGSWRRIWGRQNLDEIINAADEHERLGDKETVYSVNLLPIGGFVKIKGENGDGKDEPDSFGHQAVWRRAVILSAGVIMNVVLAWVLLSVGYMIGLPQATDSLSRGANIRDARVNVLEVAPGSPAETAGLLAGDAIVYVNGASVSRESDLQDMIAVAAGTSVELKLKRGGEEMVLNVEPALSQNSERATIGIAIFASGLVSYSWPVAFWEGAKTTVWLLGEIVRAFGLLFQQLFSGQDVSEQFAGPVGIASITGQAARLGLAHLLQFAALLSLNLAILNILPFPALDGGRLVFLLAEKIKGRPIRKEVEGLVHNAGFLLLIILIIFITYKDIVKFF